jgi:uncharacterized protein RhaS with RHS repeats
LCPDRVFTQEDPIGLAGGLNLYGYANGDPVNFSDPFGLSPCGRHELAAPTGECIHAGDVFGGALFAGGISALRGAASSAVVALGRAAYRYEVRHLGKQAEALRKAGKSPEEIARTLHAARRELGVKYKNLTPSDLRQRIYQRNLERYGDELGPSVDWLRQQGRTWEQIIRSAARTGGRDLGL